MVKFTPHPICLSLVATCLLGSLSNVALSTAALASQPTFNSQPAAKEFMQRGNKRLDQGDFRGAISDYTQAIRLNPGLARAYFNRGIAREKLQDFQGAMADYDQAVRLKPTSAAFAYGMQERANRQLNTSVPGPTPVARPVATAAALMRPPSVATPVAANITPVNVYRIAGQTTVRIDGQNPGSGVMIARAGNIYYVLTAKHVVATQDNYTLITSSGKKFPIDYHQIKQFVNLDLAVLQFTSSESFPVAELGNSEQVGQGDNIFVSGWPAVGKGITSPSHLVTEGRISGLQSGDADGYALLYSNPTAPGMSGGPVFNNNGQIIGIHGRAAGNLEIGKVGINLGIPVHLFLRQAPQIGLNIQQLRLGSALRR
jgi:S1-C subfamily serine protease